MQLADLLCYALLTIAVTATCVEGDEEGQEQEVAKSDSKRRSKRDAAILVDNFPYEPIFSYKPKMIFRRKSRQRYGPSKSKHGPPRPMYGPLANTRQPNKKYRKQVSGKYGPGNKKRTPKPRYPPNRPSIKPVYGPSKRPPVQQYYTSAPAGFAEPPNMFENQYQGNQGKGKESYAEPPVDSYGAPLKTPKEAYPTAPSFNEGSLNHYDNQNEFFDQEHQPRQNYQQESSVDNSYGQSNKRPIFVKPDELFDTPLHQDDEEFQINGYSDLNNFHNYKEPQYLHNRKKKPLYFADSNKKVNKHWKAPRYRPENVKIELTDGMLVGGQYAEPPARYVPKFQPSAPMYNGDDDFAPQQSFGDFEGATSLATGSPYVNYKNSNMAFSPQNLNDAFSVIDK